MIHRNTNDPLDKLCMRIINEIYSLAQKLRDNTSLKFSLSFNRHSDVTRGMCLATITMNERKAKQLDRLALQWEINGIPPNYSEILRMVKNS